MAGVKITELPVSGTLEKTDLTYVVDVSTDTSKQATIQDVIDAVDQISVEDVDGDAIIIAETSQEIKVQGVQGFFQGLKYRADYSTEYAPLSLIARQDAPKIFVDTDKPQNTNTIAQNYGDIYVNSSNGQAYYSTGITNDNEWQLMNDYSAATFVPTLQGALPTLPITLGRCFYRKTGNYVSVKGLLEITFGIQTFTSFNIKVNT